VTEKYGTDSGRKDRTAFPSESCAALRTCQRGGFAGPVPRRRACQRDHAEGSIPFAYSISYPLLVDVQRCSELRNRVTDLPGPPCGTGEPSFPTVMVAWRSMSASPIHDLTVSQGEPRRIRAGDRVPQHGQAEQATPARLDVLSQAPYRETFLARFKSLEPKGEEGVFDLKEPLTIASSVMGL